MESLIGLKERRREKFYTITELAKLNTKRLLTFYKKERLKYFRFSGGVYCECCGEPYSDIYPDDKYYTEEQPKIASEWKFYVDEIKNLLNSRENID
jgi:hypothetical protein